MRERTTWDRNEIAKQAAGHAKKADPYTMNQPEHAKAQPAADAYVTGTPSDFAEDVSPGTWQAEYSGGQVKRNEIGMPEFRPETFSHSEKTASEELLVKKAALCVRVARRVLPKTASEMAIEDQALAFMHLPDAELVSTYSRLAADDEQQAEQAQQKQAQQDQEQAQQAQDKQAGQMPPQFKENAEKKKEEAAEKDQGQKQAQDQAQQQQAQDDGQKQAGQSHLATAMQAMQQGNTKVAEQAMLAAVTQMAQQMMQQMAQPQQQQMPAMAQQMPTSDDQLLDQMLAEGQPQQQMMADEIELDAPSMDCGDAQLDPVADAQLMQLFANQGEAQQAEQAKQASAGVRTASTRTVGARPTAGVSRLGGGVVASNSGSGRADLSSIWNSSPDVSGVFGIPKS